MLRKKFIFKGNKCYFAFSNGRIKAAIAPRKWFHNLGSLLKIEKIIHAAEYYVH